MIIFEGPDGVGKTTFIQKLFDKGGLLNRPPFILYDWGDRSTMAETVESRYREAFAACIHSRGRIHYVFDRLFFSEVIYSQVQDRPSPLTPDTYWLYLSLIRRFPALVVWCLPDGPEQVKDSDQTEEVKALRDALYRKYLNKSVYPDKPASSFQLTYTAHINPFNEEEAMTTFAEALDRWELTWKR